MLATNKTATSMARLKCPWDARKPVVKRRLSPGKKNVGGKDSKKIIKNKIP